MSLYTHSADVEELPGLSCRTQISECLALSLNFLLPGKEAKTQRLTRRGMEKVRYTKAAMAGHDGTCLISRCSGGRSKDCLKSEARLLYIASSILARAT